MELVQTESFPSVPLRDRRRVGAFCLRRCGASEMAGLCSCEVARVMSPSRSQPGNVLPLNLSSEKIAPKGTSERHTRREARIAESAAMMRVLTPLTGKLDSETIRWQGSLVAHRLAMTALDPAPNRVPRPVKRRWQRCQMASGRTSRIARLESRMIVADRQLHAPQSAAAQFDEKAFPTRRALPIRQFHREHVTRPFPVDADRYQHRLACEPRRLRAPSRSGHPGSDMGSLLPAYGVRTSRVPRPDSTQCD